MLKKEGYKVIITRQQDATVSLDQRTSLANKERADIFFSLHANSGTASVSGVQTFYFDSSVLKNEGHSIDPQVKQTIAKTAAVWSEKSKQLARDVQSSVVAYTHALDKKIRTGVIQVLLGFEGPAALIEVGYLTNARECSLLRSEDYQNKVAEGISAGIKRFIDQHFA